VSDLSSLVSRALLPSLGAVLLACLDPTDGCGCPPTPAVGVVFGRVTTAAGEPVPNAVISAFIERGGNCSVRTSPDGVDHTRVDGSYAVAVVSGEALPALCVFVRIRAPAASELMHPPDTTVLLAFRYGTPTDSARVDARLEPR
jgi:hypothetical protein